MNFVIDDMRQQIRKIEADIMSLKQMPAIPKVTKEIDELYAVKWSLEREVLRLANTDAK